MFSIAPIQIIKHFPSMNILIRFLPNIQPLHDSVDGAAQPYNAGSKINGVLVKQGVQPVKELIFSFDLKSFSPHLVEYPTVWQ